MAFLSPNLITGALPAEGRGHARQCVVSFESSSPIPVVASGDAFSDVIDASGFVTFNLYLTLTGAPVSLYWTPALESGVGLPDQLIAAVAVGADQLITFGFRGAALDDLVFGWGYLHFTNADPVNDATVTLLGLLCSSI